MTQRITFEGETLDELMRKCRAFIGMNSSIVPIVGTGQVANTWPIPSWAPKGSKWIVKTTPPLLIGPDANEVQISWVAGTAQKPRTVRPRL